MIRCPGIPLNGIGLCVRILNIVYVKRICQIQCQQRNSSTEWVLMGVLDGTVQSVITHSRPCHRGNDLPNHKAIWIVNLQPHSLLISVKGGEHLISCEMRRRKMMMKMMIMMMLMMMLITIACTRRGLDKDCGTTEERLFILGKFKTSRSSQS